MEAITIHPRPQNPYASPWVGSNTPWTYYNGDWFLNGILYYFFGNNYGWAPYYSYAPTYIVRPNDWYAPRWNTWYQQNPHYWQSFTQRYPYWRGHQYTQRYDQNFYNQHHRDQGDGWNQGFHGVRPSGATGPGGHTPGTTGPAVRTPKATDPAVRTPGTTGPGGPHPWNHWSGGSHPWSHWSGRSTPRLLVQRFVPLEPLVLAATPLEPLVLQFVPLGLLVRRSTPLEPLVLAAKNRQKLLQLRKKRSGRPSGLNTEKAG